MVRNSAPGSPIVFNYAYRQVLDDSQKRSEISSMQRYLFMTGEGLTFGITEGSVEVFLKESGFSQVQDMNAGGLKQAYFTGINTARKVARGYVIATGVV